MLFIVRYEHLPPLTKFETVYSAQFNALDEKQAKKKFNDLYGEKICVLSIEPFLCAVEKNRWVWS